MRLAIRRFAGHFIGVLLVLTRWKISTLNLCELWAEFLQCFSCVFRKHTARRVILDLIFDASKSRLMAQCTLFSSLTVCLTVCIPQYASQCTPSLYAPPLYVTSALLIQQLATSCSNSNSLDPALSTLILSVCLVSSDTLSLSIAFGLSLEIVFTFLSGRI